MFKPLKVFPGFSVDDLSKAKEFYGKTLGMQVLEGPEGLRIILGEFEAFIYQKSNHVPATFTILNLVVEDVEKSVDALTEMGVKFEHYTGEMETDAKGIMRSGGPTIAWFKDPAGNFISVLSKELGK